MVRSARSARLEPWTAGTAASPHWPPSSFETLVLAPRGRAPQDEGGQRLSLRKLLRQPLRVIDQEILHLAGHAAEPREDRLALAAGDERRLGLHGARVVGEELTILPQVVERGAH